MVEQVMFPKSFAMIGRHDHQRPTEFSAALQFLEELTQLFVQISETIIVGIFSQDSKVRGQLVLLTLPNRQGSWHRRRICGRRPKR